MNKKLPKNRLIFLCGATASGKSELALKIASRINAEIINCDSMQVYKQPKIITNRLLSKDIKKIKHHLLGVVSVKDEFDVARFLALVKPVIEKIHKKGKIPLFVVGTGLYMKALLDGMFTLNSTEKDIRANLYALVKKYGINYLYKRLVRVDKISALKLHKHDLRRIVRALEVYKTTGRRISDLQKDTKGIADDYKLICFVINVDRVSLYETINTRTDAMFKKGFLKEAKRLLKLPLSESASQILGLKQVKSFLDGKITLLEAKELIKRDTRRYAKRQLSWFRHDKTIKFKTKKAILNYFKKAKWN